MSRLDRKANIGAYLNTSISQRCVLALTLICELGY